MTISLGKSTGHPDAEAALRTALAIVELLVAVDKGDRPAFGHPRYQWRISDLHTGSAVLDIEGVCAEDELPNFDAVGTLIGNFRAIESGRVEQVTRLNRDDFKKVALIGDGPNGKDFPTQIMIPTELGKGLDVYTATRTLRRNAKAMRTQIAAIKPEQATEYAVIEGLLTAVENDPREGHLRHSLSVIDRETDDKIHCAFRPEQAGIIGAHVGHTIIVEGDLTTEDGVPKYMIVQAFRLVPKVPLSAAEIAALRLRIPGNWAMDDYILDLRADHG